MDEESVQKIARVFDAVDEKVSPLIGTFALESPGSLLPLLRFVRFESRESVDHALAELADLLRAHGGDAEAKTQVEAALTPDELREINESTKNRFGLSESECRSWADFIQRVRRSLPTLWIIFGTGRLLHHAFKLLFSDEHEGGEQNWLDGTIWEGVSDDIRQAAVVAKKQVSLVTVAQSAGVLLSLDSSDLSDEAAQSLCPENHETMLMSIDDICHKFERSLIKLRTEREQCSPGLLREQIAHAKDFPAIEGIHAKSEHQVANELADRVIRMFSAIYGEVRRFLDTLPSQSLSFRSKAVERLLEVRDALARLPEFDLQALIQAIEAEALCVAQRRAELNSQEPNDLLTTAEFARLACVGEDRIRNVLSKERNSDDKPIVVVKSSGTRGNQYSYRQALPFLRRIWPDKSMNFPNSIAEAKKILKASKLSD